MSHRGASAGGPARPSPNAASRAPKCGARGREPVDLGGPKGKRTRAGGFGRVWGTPRALPPAPPLPPRSAGRPVRRQEEEGRARAGPARPPLGQGPAGRGPRSARSASSGSQPRLPAHRPSPEGVSPTGGERGGGGNRRCGAPSGGRAPSPPPTPPRPWSGGGAEEGRRMDGWTDGRRPPRRAHRAPARADKPLCRGLTFNRSQRGSCSATYETPTQKQVVYEWFSARFPTNVRCVTGEGAAAFPAAPRFPGRRALRTGPRSRRAAGHAPRGARRPAGGDRRGTGYPRPTEAPRRCRIVPPGRDSDLEAFSHNPTHGSFAPLAFQPSAMTNCANQRFLSY